MTQQDVPFDSIAVDFGIFAIHWYGIILAIATAIGLWLVVREGKRKGIPSDFLVDTTLFAIPFALIGARMYYVVFQWEYFSNHWLEVFAIWKGGIAIYGAIIGAVLAVGYYVRKHKKSFSLVADIAAPGFLIGQAIGRWGNFMNQEAYGAVVAREELRFLPDWLIEQMWIAGQYRQPTFLYESVWCLVGLVLVLLVRRTSWIRVGEVALFYVGWYSLGRFFIEGLRADSLVVHAPVWFAHVLETLWAPMTWFVQSDSWEIGVVRVSQLLSLVLFVFAFGVLFWRRRTDKQFSGVTVQHTTHEGGQRVNDKVVDQS